MTPLEVLKNKDYRTMLYSPCYGHVTLDSLSNGARPIFVKSNEGVDITFLESGKVTNYEGSQVMLFPSVNLKEWDKFNFKKGDILQHDGGMEVVEFIEYETSEENPANNYTMFKGRYILPEEAKGNVDYFTTWCFSPVKPLEKSKIKKFKPFDKVLYINEMKHYHIDFVEKYLDNGCVYLMSSGECVPNHAVFPYKDEMECLIREIDNEETEKKLEEILSNE